MAASTQTAVSDGTLVLLNLSFDYLDRSEITVFYDSVLQLSGWSWVGLTEKQLAFSPAVPNGVTVLVKRTTELASLRHVYTTGAAFTATSLDESLSQVLHIAQESFEGNLSGEFYADINMHTYKIKNIGLAVDPNDALTLAQYQADALSAYTYKEQARVYAEAAAQSANDAVTQVNGVLRTGDTMTGPLALAANATLAMQAVPFQQLNSVIAAVMNAAYPVGTIYENAAVNTNPATFLGFGTWVAMGVGRVLVSFDAGNALFNTAGATGGAYDAVAVAHTHTITDPGHSHTVPANTAGGTNGLTGALGYTTTAGTFTSGASATGVSINDAGVSGVNANLQPFEVVFRWKRTA